MQDPQFHIYTGNGKGKTTASLGLAIRALSNNLNVYFIQFLKARDTSESILNKFNNFTFKQFGTKEFLIDNKTSNNNNSRVKLKLETKKAIEYINNLLSSKKQIDMLILDEINIAIYYKLITLKEVNNIIKKAKQKNLEIIFTGRYAKDSLIKKADLVSEIKEIKHYYKKNINARLGIEY